MNQEWKHVRKNQINNSSSKSTYAFSKSTRFDSLKQLCDSFYNIPSHMGKTRSAGIGKGNKMAFSDTEKVPSPGNYNIKSHFDQNQKGIKFSLGRENIKYGGILTQSDTPQPGRYSTHKHNQPRAYSIRKKLQPLVPSFKLSPGPGQYNAQATISGQGKYTLSHLSNCAAPKIKPTKNYDESKYRKTPGPGAYNQEKQNMNSSGLFFNSKYTDSRCRSFSRSSRKDVVPKGQKKLPGPGSYNYFSEFGRR